VEDEESGDSAVNFDVGLPFTIQRVSPNYKNQMIEINLIEFTVLPVTV
jgi:hypothetical protein